MFSMIIVLPLVILWLTYRWFRHKNTIDNYGSRYVFITGCDSGFGNMLTKRLDGLGFNVFAGCLTQDGEEKLTLETSEKVKTIRIDVSETESIEDAFNTVKSSLPSDTGLWGVVNNAGITGNLGPVEWLTRKHYQAVFEINVLGIVETSRIFLPLLIKEKGRIVNITSMMGRIAAANPTYIVSKFAAEGYSDILRRELYKRGVTVHILEPGFFQTNLTDVERLSTAVDGFFGDIPSKLNQYYGQVYVDEWKDIIRKTITTLESPHTHLVVDAYVHALTSKYPNYRYLKLVVGQYSTVSVHEYGRKLKRFQDMINDKDQEINCLKVQVNEAENATNRARSMLKDTNKRKPLSTETLTTESLSCASTNKKPRQAEVEVGDGSQDLEPVTVAVVEYNNLTVYLGTIKEKTMTFAEAKLGKLNHQLSKKKISDSSLQLDNNDVLEIDENYLISKFEGHVKNGKILLSEEQKLSICNSSTNYLDKKI